MTIIYDSCEKTISRHTFGRGILASRPVHRAPASLEDLRWAAEHLNDADMTTDWDALGEWATAMELIEAGYAPF